MKPKNNDSPESNKRLDAIAAQLDLITTRLDLLVDLMLDTLPEVVFRTPRDFTAKLERLDSMHRFQLKPADAGRIFRRGSNDVSSRRKEIKAKRKRNARR